MSNLSVSTVQAEAQESAHGGWLHIAGRLAGHVAFGVALVGTSAWAATALALQLDGPVRALTLCGLAAGVLGAVAARVRSRRAGWLALAGLGLLVGLWYATIRPQQDRTWAPDVAHGVTGEIVGDAVTLHHVRDFRWTARDQADEAWETRRYDLAQLTGVDVLTSMWDSPDIAHLLVSFGFAGGQRVAFSVEIRREAHEAFSSLGGFFRQFELVVIAADEADIVRLRTTLRGEDVRLYPLDIDPDLRRRMFLSYVTLGNDLAERPTFYNTLTANCSTTVWGLARTLRPDLPFDRRIVLSGGLPDYLDDLGALPGDAAMTDRRAAAAITERARAVPDGADFSAAIREGI